MTNPPQKKVGNQSLQLAFDINKPDKIKITISTAIPIPNPGKITLKNSETIVNLIDINEIDNAIKKLIPLLSPKTPVEVRIPKITEKINKTGKKKSKTPEVSHW